MSNKATFELAASKLAEMGYTLDMNAKVTDQQPAVKNRSETRTWKQRPIANTNGYVVVMYNKVYGMKGSYDAVAVNGDKAIAMKLHAMTQPPAEAYKELLG